jgi:hypothetical protein
MPLGILVDKGLQHINHVFIPIFSSEDSFLMDYAQKLIYNSNSHITVLDVNSYVKTNFVLNSAISSLEQKYPKNITLVNDKIIKKEFLAKQDLMMISIESWKSLVDSQSIWLSGVPSVLIMKH